MLKLIAIKLGFLSSCDVFMAKAYKHIMFKKMKIYIQVWWNTEQILRNEGRVTVWKSAWTVQEIQAYQEKEIHIYT